MTKDMSKENKATLVRVAELTETVVPDDATKADILVALQENEVDQEYYEEFIVPQLESETETNADEVSQAPKASPGTITTASLGFEDKTPVAEVQEEQVEAYEPSDDSDEMLLRYTGFSRWFEKGGYTFRRDHPFTPVKKSDVEKLLSASTLLRLASPKEAQDFYS